MLSWIRSLYAEWGGDHSGRSGSETETETGTHTGGDAPEIPDTETPGELGDRAEVGSCGTSTSWHDLLDGEQVSKEAVQLELGLQPHEFVAWLVRYSGGQMWQSDVVETTGWSKSTVSRYLDTLESGDIVERVWIGRRKLVGVPGQMPDPVSVSEESSSGSPTDAWS